MACLASSDTANVAWRSLLTEHRRLSALQNGRIARQILPYRLLHDATFCATLRDIRASKSIARKPYSVLRKFFLDMETLSLSKSTTCPMTSRRRPRSVLSSVTVQWLSLTVNLHQNMLRWCHPRTCLQDFVGHVTIPIVTTWKAAGVHAQPNIPAIWRYTKIVRRPQGKKRAECTLPINPFSRGLCLPIWSWGHGQVPVAKRSWSCLQYG